MLSVLSFDVRACTRKKLDVQRGAKMQPQLSEQALLKCEGDTTGLREPEPCRACSRSMTASVDNPLRERCSTARLYVVDRGTRATKAMR